MHLIADLRTRQGALFLPMLGTKRRWKRSTNRDKGMQPVVGEERAINAPHPATPASPFCCPGRVYLEHHQKQHFEHNQHLEGHNENSRAAPSRGAGSLGITLAGFTTVLVLSFKSRKKCASEGFSWPSYRYTRIFTRANFTRATPSTCMLMRDYERCGGDGIME